MKSWGHWHRNPLVLPTHLPPGQEPTQTGQQKRQQKQWQRWSLHQAPQWQIHQEVCGYRAAVNKLQSWSLCLAHSSPDSEPRRETSYQHRVFDRLPVHLAESSITRRGADLQQHQTGAVNPQWIPSHCGVGGNEEADRLSKMGSKLEQSAHPMSYREAKAIQRKL